MGVQSGLELPIRQRSPNKKAKYSDRSENFTTQKKVSGQFSGKLIHDSEIMDIRIRPLFGAWRRTFERPSRLSF